jgi:hypothetical protein
MPTEPNEQRVSPPRNAVAPTIVVSCSAPPVAPLSGRGAPPLSNVAVASRVGTVQAAPIVHVTIDRIDLRAPDVAKSTAPAKPARRPPAISLADYLRNSRSGSRA